MARLFEICKPGRPVLCAATWSWWMHVCAGVALVAAIAGMFLRRP